MKYANLACSIAWAATSVVAAAAAMVWILSLNSGEDVNALRVSLILFLFSGAFRTIRVYLLK